MQMHLKWHTNTEISQLTTENLPVKALVMHAPGTVIYGILLWLLL